MRIPRRRFLRLSAGAAAASAWPLRSGFAQSYPSRPVRLVVGFAAAGPTDVLARMMAQRLSERLGQQFVVENRPGASGNIATEGVVNAPADGHTLLLIAPANTINVSLFDKLPFDFVRDVAPVGSVMRAFYVMVVTPSLPVRTVPEFIAYAKANPGRINMGSAGAGTPQHVAGEFFKMMTGTDMAHVPYRGSAPAMTDLIGNQIQVMFDNLTTSLEQIRAGRVRALAVTTLQRAEALPELPTVADFVPGFEASATFGIGTPRNTPAAIVELLNREINAGLADPKIKARIADFAGVALPGTPGDYSALIAAEVEKWGKVIRTASIKAE